MYGVQSFPVPSLVSYDWSRGCPEIGYAKTRRFANRIACSRRKQQKEGTPMPFIGDANTFFQRKIHFVAKAFFLLPLLLCIQHLVAAAFIFCLVRSVKGDCCGEK